MEQIRQLLSQLSLHLELNIAMCDMIERMEKRLDELEPSHKALQTKVNALYTQLSEMRYHQASKAYESRQEALKGNK